MNEPIKKPFKHTLGAWSVWSLSDGYIDIDQIVIIEAPKEALERVLREEKVACLEPFVVRTDVNAFLVKTEQHLILVDTGSGNTMGEHLGHVPRQIESLGYTLSDITHVLITHLHGDHMCGLVDDQGQAAFPKAKVYVSVVDAAFWRDKRNQDKVREGIRGFFDQAIAALAPYEARGDLILIEPSQYVLEGVEVVEAYGHTPGHVGFELCSQGEKLLLWADIVHNVAVQLRHPEWCIAFDTDGKLGAMSRQKMLRRVVDEQLLIGGGHLPYPALGHIKRQDDRLVWEPLS